MKTLFAALLYFMSAPPHFYDFSFVSESGDTISMSGFATRQVLIVNTSSDSLFDWQYDKLEQLYQAHKDKLVVIAFPSNSFGKEPTTDSAIFARIHTHHDIHFILAHKAVVTGSEADPLYHWLGTGSENGNIYMPPTGDFQKYFVDTDGSLIAGFAGAVDPVAEDITSLIKL